LFVIAPTSVDANLDDASQVSAPDQILSMFVPPLVTGLLVLQRLTP